MIYKDIGIVIKQNEFSDYDRILTILTKGHGKISAIAKGVRKLSSKKAAACDLFVMSKFSFAEGKNLDIVTEVVPLNAFEEIKEDYKSIEILFYIGQIVDNLIIEGDNLQSKEIFAIFEDCLNLLGKKDISDDKVLLIIRVFEIKILKILGVLPDFYECMNCGKTLSESELFYFVPNLGGIVCKDCNETGIPNISKNTIKVLRFLSEKNMKEAIAVSCSKEILSELDMVCKALLEYFADLNIK
jgi:DNA repair protein RecO (recombination protein O)